MNLFMTIHNFPNLKCFNFSIEVLLKKANKINQNITTTNQIKNIPWNKKYKIILCWGNSETKWLFKNVQYKNDQHITSSQVMPNSKNTKKII